MGEPSDDPTRLRSVARDHHPDGDVASNNTDTVAGPSFAISPPNRPLSQNQQTSDGHGGFHRTSGPAAIDARKVRRGGGKSNINSSSNENDNQEFGDPSAAATPATASPEAAQVEGEKPSALDSGPGGGDEKPKSAVADKPPIPTRLWNGSKRFVRHTKAAVMHSYVNVLLVFVPIGIAANFAKLNADIVFAMNAIAIIPLAGLLTRATESVARRLGDTLGALLNVSFGNAVELIIFIALVKDEISIVQASLLGSILANLLLILGMSFLFGGLRFQEQIYNNTVTQMSACLLSLSVMSLLLPTAFHASFSDTSSADRQTLKISRGTSVVLLLVYILYLLFQLKSHAYLYESMPQERIDEESHPGLLADILDSSTSSSSSSDTDDSDDTAGSHTTAKRLRRAFRRAGRRKSSASSDKPLSVPSHLSSPTTEPTGPWSDGSVSAIDHHRHRSNSHASQLHAIVSGDEADTEVDADRAEALPHVRDFENKESSKSKDRIPSPERRFKKRKKQYKKAKAARKAAQMLKHHGPTDSDMAAAASGGKAPAEGPQPAQVAFAENVQRTPTQESTAPSKRPFNLRQISAKPALHKVLTQNVFVAPPELPKIEGRPVSVRATTGVRRTNSLPDLRYTRKPLPPYVVRAPPPTVSDDDGDEEPQMSRTAAVVMLLVSTGLVALCAEFLVNAIPDMVSQSSVSQAFIGLIILPIVGNAAEHVTAVAVATKNKMDLAIGVAVGSSIQIALFVTPLIVILGWILNKSMTLYFNLFETVSLFVTAFVVNFLVLDGKSNYLEGTLLIAAYIIIAVAAFFYPSSASESPLGGSDAVNATTAAAHFLKLF